MLKKALASAIAIVAVLGLVTGPASARHKKMSYKHGQTTGMSTSTGKTGAGPSGQPAGASTPGSSGSAGSTGSSGATGK